METKLEINELKKNFSFDDIINNSIYLYCEKNKILNKFSCLNNLRINKNIYHFLDINIILDIYFLQKIFEFLKDNFDVKNRGAVYTPSYILRNKRELTSRLSVDIESNR